VTQLQFLPLLYADSDDVILVSDLPDNPDPRLCLFEKAPKGLPIEHWGPSQAIASWAKSQGIPYSIPDWDLIRTINSKIFSFNNSPQLPGAELLHTQAEIASWIEKTPGPKVLKTPFGTAGKGHLFPHVKQLYTPPLIGEPWVERVLDFSTQWKNGKLLGVTCFENEIHGTYKGTFVGKVDPWALEEHLTIAKSLVEKVGQMGYRDHIGIDAFIYLRGGKKTVHPIVEINARKTMSWAALQTPSQQLYYTRKSNGLLPKELLIGTKRICFSRNIQAEK
jgi:hypothetical protein